MKILVAVCFVAFGCGSVEVAANDLGASVDGQALSTDTGVENPVRLGAEDGSMEDSHPPTVDTMSETHPSGDAGASLPFCDKTEMFSGKECPVMVAGDLCVLGCAVACIGERGRRCVPDCGRCY